MWLQQMGGGAGGLAGREAAEQLQQDRSIKHQQDAEYEASASADWRRQEEREAARKLQQQEREAAGKLQQEQETKRRRLVELKEQLARQLGPEPGAGGEGMVVVRVRLPCGAVRQRRWDGGAGVGAVTDWVQVGPGVGLQRVVSFQLRHCSATHIPNPPQFLVA